MWNTLLESIADVSIKPSTVPGFVIAIIWISLTVYAIMKLVVEKPWGAKRINRRNTAKNERLRLKRFDDTMLRINQSPEAIERYENILQLEFFQLKDALQSDKLSALEVLEAYIWKAYEVHQQTNCLIDFIAESFNEAKSLDERWRGHPNKPPLFGLPFSVKGNLFLKGYDCTVGLAKNLFDEKQSECSLITHLRQQGAVPFAITNVPQALLSFVCSNPLYGTTTNPFDSNRTPGGSSGGEAALLAGGGSTFGTGSDLAGSLRIPASMCGLYTLKPTEARLVVVNAQGGLPGRGRLGLAFGFLAKSVEQLQFLMSTTVGSNDYRKLAPKSAPLPLSMDRIKSLQNKKLRIGYFVDDGFMRAVPACERSVREAVAKLKEYGHEMIAFSIPNPNYAASLFYKNLLPDRGQYTLQLYRYEDVTKYMKRFVMLLKVPRIVRKLASWLLSPISRQMSVITGSYVSDLADLRYSQQLTDQYVNDFIEEWKLFELDALICPAFPVPSVPNEYPSELPMCAFASGFFNMIDFPAGIVPTGFVSKQDDNLLNDDDHWPVGRNVALKKVRQACQHSAGLPIGVQVVSLPYQEEECLVIMQQIETLVKGSLSSTD